jgi:hypothetical protein
VKEDPDFEKLRPNFMWPPVDIIEKTWERTAQFAKSPVSDAMKKRHKSPHPALNVCRRDEAVAADTAHSDTPAVDGGETAAQIFVGTDSAIIDAHGMKSEATHPSEDRGIFGVTEFTSVSVCTDWRGRARDITDHRSAGVPSQNERSAVLRRWSSISLGFWFSTSSPWCLLLREARLRISREQYRRAVRICQGCIDQGELFTSDQSQRSTGGLKNRFDNWDSAWLTWG